MHQLDEAPAAHVRAQQLVQTTRGALHATIRNEPHNVKKQIDLVLKTGYTPEHMHLTRDVTLRRTSARHSRSWGLGGQRDRHNRLCELTFAELNAHGVNEQRVAGDGN